MPWTEHGNYYHYEEYLSETEEDLTQYIEANKKPTKKEWNAILLSAVADADFQTVHRLRRRGASVNAKDQEVSVLGCSPLVNSDKRRFSTGTERTVDSLPQL